MKILKKVLLHVLLVLLSSLPTRMSQKTAISHCGKIRIQNQFFLQDSSQLFPLNHMLLCKAEKLYYRTTLGLFQVTSIDYKSKLLTVSHSYWSSACHFISPTVLAAGFPQPPQPNSLVLLNCSSQKSTPSAFTSCSGLNGYRGSSMLHQQLAKGAFRCLVIEDAQKLDLDFHPKELNCTHYSRMYRKASVDDSNYGFELGTRISFDIPGHVPNPCDECKKPNGNCGIGLRCICHPKECSKD